MEETTNTRRQGINGKKADTMKTQNTKSTTAHAAARFLARYWFAISAETAGIICLAYALADTLKKGGAQ